MPENYLLSFPFDWFKHLSHLGKKKGGGEGTPSPLQSLSVSNSAMKFYCKRFNTGIVSS